MATFKLGDKVRVVKRDSSYCGRETEVIGFCGGLVEVALIHSLYGVPCQYFPHNLEPITPPRREEVVEWSEMPCDRNGRYIPREVHV